MADLDKPYKPYKPEIQYDLASFNKLRRELIKRAVTEGNIAEGFIDNCCSRMRLQRPADTPSPA